jgi:hypothetical protein
MESPKGMILLAASAAKTHIIWWKNIENAIVI